MTAAGAAAAPAPRRVVVEADGGSRGNPGPAGYGAVVRDAASGATLAERAAGIGVATNNVAEYRGLLAGLAAALDLGAREVEVRMDSKLVVEQMSGRWQVKHADMRALAGEASVLVRRFARVEFRHVPRERNTHADRLANEAMDAQQRGQPWQPAPVERLEADRGEIQPEAVGGQPRLVGFDGDEGRPVRLVLLRHGQTAQSVERRFSGGGGDDVPLTAYGRDQADRAARRLAARGGIDTIASSPLRRAQETAQAVAAAVGVPVTVDAGLTETAWGEWDGLTAAQVRERWPELYLAWLTDPQVAPPGGESVAAAERRVRAARLRLLARHPGRAVLVVTHTTPIKLVIGEAVGAGLAALYRVHVDLASLSEVDYHPDGHPVVRVVNDVAHLEGVASDAAQQDGR